MSTQTQSPNNPVTSEPRSRSRSKNTKTMSTTTTNPSPGPFAFKSSPSRITPDETMEKSVILLPTLKEGVVALGDLWDCRSNQCTGSFFDKTLTKEYLQADVCSSTNYTMHRLKKASDVASMLNISASLKIEIPISAGNIEISGSGNFESTENAVFNEENIAVQYEATTYRVRVLPSAEKLVSQRVKDNIMSERMTATHYVDSVILGGKATASIRFKEKTDNSKLSIGGSFQVKIEISGIVIDAQAQMQLENTESSEDIDTAISVVASPKWKKTPTKVEDVWEEVENIDANLQAEQHFPQLYDPEFPERIITGVPILYRLVPISNLIDFELEGIYKMLKEDLMNDFTDMIFTLQDYSSPGHILTVIVEEEPKLIPILLDEANPLVIEIRTYANEMSKLARELKQEAATVFVDYKFGKFEDGEAALRAQIKEYDERFKVWEVTEKIFEFRRTGRMELNGIRASDVNGIVDDNDQPTIRFFSNKQDLEEWFFPERTIKVLLQTNYDYGSPSGVFLKLYDMSPALVKKGIEVGVAFPNISDNFSLTFKSLKASDVYAPSDIPFMLHVMGVAVDDGESIEHVFYSVNAALSGLQLPMHDHMYDIPNLVTIMEQFRDTLICETYCELLAKLLETKDTWNFVLPVQALYTSVEMMRFYRQLKRYIPTEMPSLPHRWLVSKFNDVSDKFYSPLLLVFKDDVLQAVCLDHLDIRILIDELKRSPTPDLSTISYHRMRESCLYPPRADFAATIVQNLILEHGARITDPVPDLPEYENNTDKFLPPALQVVGASCMRNERIILTSVCRLALAEYDDQLEAVLSKYGWVNNEFSLEGWRKIDWEDMYKDLQQFLEQLAPYLMKVVLAAQSLKVLMDDDKITDEDLQIKITQIISFLDEPKPFNSADDGNVGPRRKIRVTSYIWRGKLINEDDLFQKLREEVLSYSTMPVRIQLVGITKTFETFILTESTKEEFFDVFQTMTLVEGMKKEGVKSLKPLLLPVCKRYCERVAVTEEGVKYPRAHRRLNDSLNEGQLFKTVGVLSEIAYHPMLYRLHQELFNIVTLPAPVNAKSTIEKMSPDDGFFTEPQLEIVWTNPKFLYMLRQVLANDSVVDTLYIHIKEITENQKFASLDEGVDLLEYGEKEEDLEKRVGEEVELYYPFWIPVDVVEKVKNMVASRTTPSFDWEKVWKSVDVLIEQLQIIVTRQQIPVDFGEILRDNVEDEIVIKDALEAADALLYWNDTESIFYHPWSLSTIETVLDRLMISNQKRKQVLPKRKMPQPSIKLNIKPNSAESNKPRSAQDSAKSELVLVNDKWAHLVESKSLQTIPWNNYFLLDKLHPTTYLEYERLGETGPTVAAFIAQQLKMYNAGILHQKYVTKFLNYPLPGPRPGQIDFGDGFPIKNLGLLLTRGDIQTMLFHLTDSVVTNMILSSMVKTPLAVPLIVTSIEKEAGIIPTTSNTGSSISVTKCRMLVDALKDVIVPEFAGTLPQPRLFVEPFRFVLTLRVGTTGLESGRSSFINEYLTRDKTVFGSLNDPGRQIGRALNRDGLLELIHLSSTTAEPGWWSGSIQPEYERGQMMILLGALHGDALSLLSLFELLRPYVSTYVVFWKVANLNELKAKKQVLDAALGKNAKILDVILYPDSTIVDKVHEQNLLFRSQDDGTVAAVNQAKLQRIFTEAIKYSKKDTSTQSTSGTNSLPPSSFLASFSLPKGAKPLSTMEPISVTMMPSMSTPESQVLVDYIRNNSIGNIQKGIQSGDFEIIEGVAGRMANCMIGTGSTGANMVAAFHHISQEVDILSRNESKEAVDRIRKLRAMIEDKYAHDPNPEEAWVLSTQEELKWSLEQLRLHTLSLPDLFRVLWSVDFGTDATPLLQQAYADVISAGFPTELFHPTHSTKPFEHEVGTVLELIPPSTRVFIVSTMGLKESGKSYLLNRLFGGSRFTEHSTTFGLQFRLLWLSDELKHATDCDAFLILDSEGVGNPENKIDQSADSLERKVTTLLLGASNLSLNTLLGTGLKEVGSILEVAMASLSKLEEVPCPPDMTLVQHQYPGQPPESKRNLEREFSTCLEATLALTESREVPLGLNVRSSHRIYQVKSRNNHFELVHVIKPLTPEVVVGGIDGKMFADTEQGDAYRTYHEDVQALYQKIIKIAVNTRQTRWSLGNWIEKTLQLWEDISSSPLQKIYSHPSAKAVDDSVTFEERIASVKKAIDAAYFFHEKKATSAFNTAIEYLFNYEEEYTTDFDSKLDLALNAVMTELNKAINTCDALVDEIKRGRVSSRRKLKASMAAEVNPSSCLACEEAFSQRESLFGDVVRVKKGFLVVENVTHYMGQVKAAIFQRLRQSIVAKQITQGKSSGELATRWEEALTDGATDEEKFTIYLKYVSTLQYIAPARHNFHAEMVEVYEDVPRVVASHSPEGDLSSPDLEPMIAFDVQIYNRAVESSVNAPKAEKMTWVQHDWLMSRLEDIPRKMKDDFESVLYRIGMARELQIRIQGVIFLFEEYCGERVLPKFQWEIHVTGVHMFSKFIEEQQKAWDMVVMKDETKTYFNNPLQALRDREDEFANLFTTPNPTKSSVSTYRDNWRM